MFLSENQMAVFGVEGFSCVCAEEIKTKAFALEQSTADSYMD
jgi:hypothetical protein